MLAEGTSGNSYTTRANNIRIGGGANGTITLGSSAVADDGASDTLGGHGSLDWFLFGVGDKLKVKAGGELVN